MDDIFHTKRSS